MPSTTTAAPESNGSRERPRPLEPRPSTGAVAAARIGRTVRRALRQGGRPASHTRDALARGVLRSAIFTLETVAVAFLIGGGVGIVAQLGAADSIGPALWLPVLAIGVVTGFAALLALAVASVFVLQLRMSRDLEELRQAVLPPPPTQRSQARSRTVSPDSDGEPQRQAG